ncbi:hypothetical protein [Paenarthrobacter nitroguajacolicus]
MAHKITVDNRSVSLDLVIEPTLQGVVRAGEPASARVGDESVRA